MGTETSSLSAYDCCKSRELAYNCNMKHVNYRASIAELAESEGVFTTAQAARLGVPRDALHDAVESGRLERVARGCYRLVGSGSSYTDELAAIWKMTSPSAFIHERAGADVWDGVAVGGSTAASLLGIGDFYLSPYRIYTPKRFNSRNRAASFAVREVPFSEVSIVEGMPVTSAERTVFDLVADHEDDSLVADALRDACQRSGKFDFAKLRCLLASKYGEKKAARIFDALLSDAHVNGGRDDE